MASTTTNGAERREAEMSRNLVGLVDNCFEEGKYEDGIAMLGQLRSANVKPKEYVIINLSNPTSILIVL